jgi:hypothetical protein
MVLALSQPLQTYLPQCSLHRWTLDDTLLPPLLACFHMRCQFVVNHSQLGLRNQANTVPVQC